MHLGVGAHHHVLAPGHVLTGEKKICYKHLHPAGTHETGMTVFKFTATHSRDTASEDALLVRPGATDPLLATREVATDAQIDALRQGLPHLTDPASLQDGRAGKQPAGTGTTEKCQQSAAQKRTRTTRHDTERTGAGLGRLAGRSC